MRDALTVKSKLGSRVVARDLTDKLGEDWGDQLAEDGALVTGTAVDAILEGGFHLGGTLAAGLLALHALLAVVSRHRSLYSTTAIRS
jgi:hypothetical protein